MFSDGVRFDEYHDPKLRVQHKDNVAESDEDYTSSSSSGEESDASAVKRSSSKNSTKVLKKKKSSSSANNKPVMDAAEYQRQRAREEWLRATGQAPAASGVVAPSPPRNAKKPTSAGSPVPAESPNTRRTLENASGDVAFITEKKPLQQSALSDQQRAQRPGSSHGRMHNANDPLHGKLKIGYHAVDSRGGKSYVDPSALGDTFSASELQIQKLRTSQLDVYRKEGNKSAHTPDGAERRPASAAGKKKNASDSKNVETKVSKSPNQTVHNKEVPASTTSENGGDDLSLGVRKQLNMGVASLADQAEEKDNVPEFNEDGTQKTVSRKDFLRMLDLLGDDDEDRATAAIKAAEKEREAEHTELLKNVAKAEQEERAHFSDRHLRSQEQQQAKLYQERFEAWKNADDDTPFLAEKEDKLAKVQTQQPFDPERLHYQLKQTGGDFFENQQKALERFEKATTVLEDLVVSSKFVNKVNHFLQKHHKEFLNSMPERQAGEFRHADFLVFRDYTTMVQKVILETLNKKVKDFDEDEFFDRVFDTRMSMLSQEREEDAGVGSSITETALEENENGDESGAESPSKWKGRRKVAQRVSAADASEESALSFEVWEVLLSFMKFECFNELMDEFIGSFYGTSVMTSSGAGASAVGTTSSALSSSRASSASTAGISSTVGGGSSAAGLTPSNASTRSSTSTTSTAAKKSTKTSSSTASTGTDLSKRRTSPTPTTGIGAPKRSLREMRNLPNKMT